MTKKNILKNYTTCHEQQTMGFLVLIARAWKAITTTITHSLG
jgi:hypothetical protein